MIHYYLLSRHFGILTCFLASTVAREVLFGGLLAESTDFPYVVSVQIHDEGHVCGGGIIGERFILTAAQCVLNRDRHLRSTLISILAGTNNLNRVGPPAVTVRVETVFFPKEYHPTIEFNYGDITVLKLVDSIQLNRRTNLARLKFPRTHHPDNEDAWLAGFNSPNFNVGNKRIIHNTGQLRYATSVVLSNDECERFHPHGAFESEKHLCATVRPDNISTYSGDIGGPLVDDHGTVVGVLSRVPRFHNEENDPEVYTRVAHYTHMIINIMEHGRDPSITSLNT